jgi:hypothetical protein
LLIDEFCPGGERWPLPGQSKRLSGFEIPENRDRLEMVIDHEDYLTVRSAVAPLLEATRQSLSVEMDICIEPVAGKRATIPAHLAPVLQRLGIVPEGWCELATGFGGSRSVPASRLASFP